MARAVGNLATHLLFLLNHSPAAVDVYELFRLGIVSVLYHPYNTALIWNEKNKAALFFCLLMKMWRVHLWHRLLTTSRERVQLSRTLGRNRQVEVGVWKISDETPREFDGVCGQHVLHADRYPSLHH